MSRLTPGAAHVVEQFEPAGHVDIDELGLAAARELEQQLMAEVPHEPSIADVSDHTMAGPECDIPLRVYRPDAPPSSGTLSSGTPSSGTLSSGTIVFFHGGGWVMGNIELADTLCRGIARASEAAVVSVGYRLAPENPLSRGAR
ncbi:MAG: alpha/beta hydrolase fold domain-containing protein [Acidimicrobiia bacterium]|nr:alpha/beta hydrolase fold domain-containing protein [Acidimicrobiia bacterium]